MAENNKEVLDQELLKALEDILGKDNVSEADIVKAKEEDIKEEDKEDDDEGVEKAYNSKKEAYENLEKSCAMAKGELEEMEAKMSKKKKVEKAEGEDIVKGEEKKTGTPKEDLVKSEANILLTTLTESLGEIKKSLETQTETSNDIQKSLNDVKEENQELKKALEEMGNDRPGMKSMSNAHFIEKGESQDEDGKSILSVTADKSKIEEILSKAADEEVDDTIKKSLTDDLLGYNMGGAQLSQSTAVYFLNKKNIRLTK